MAANAPTKSAAPTTAPAPAKSTDDLRAEYRAARTKFRALRQELQDRLPPQPTASRPRIGGTFAPPLDADGLAAYRALAASAQPQVGEAMLKLCDMLETFRQTPRSVLPGVPHPAGRGLIVPLAQAEIDRIWDAVPYPEECDMYAALFERIDPAARPDLRNAAFHLLWFARELVLDREPITNDLL